MKCKIFFISSSIGKKTLMAITGLLLIGFLITHLIGNFLLFDFLGGAQVYNDYSHALTSNPLIYGAEVVLLCLIIFHICSAITVTIANRRARPTPYSSKSHAGESTFASRTMFHTGMIIFIFIVLHLITFKFGDEYYTCEDYKDCVTCKVSSGQVNPQKINSTCKLSTTNPSYKSTTKNCFLQSKCFLSSTAKATDDETAYCGAKGKKRDIYRTVVECFAMPWYSAIYILCILALGIHLSHGIQSAFQTLGINHPKYNNFIKKGSYTLAIILTIGYLIFPIFFGLIKGADLCQ